MLKKVDQISSGFSILRWLGLSSLWVYRAVAWTVLICSLVVALVVGVVSGLAAFFLISLIEFVLWRARALRSRGWLLAAREARPIQIRRRLRPRRLRTRLGAQLRQRELNSSFFAPRVRMVRWDDIACISYEEHLTCIGLCDEVWIDATVRASDK